MFDQLPSEKSYYNKSRGLSHIGFKNIAYCQVVLVQGQYLCIK